ncbi:sigma-70 family RNA polymerase sigma factor [Leucobacter ruminantium]|uniref:Sigma-70 family RNA polymerase sigma factor n=1 Tax=Leucobacter ruminantium TaxID=1289170 RepID=A0A939RXX3_9MICO|nr:sigma-70 family RNA polymerase sigma factor [Leucobacter ruminantium]MBO1806632.1 sigma-70 family RNA polymerase sigma factor [Leucobacter ruminantium]
MLSRARNGDREAYAELWARHRGAALTTARPLAFSDAEDVVSEAFAAIWDQLQRGGGPKGHFRAYVLTAVRNIAARWYRDRQRAVMGIEAESDTVPGGEAYFEASDERRLMAAALAALPERWRTVLWLLEVEDVPRGRVADHLGLSPNAVSVLVRRAKEGLRLAWMRQLLPPDNGVAHPATVELLPRYVRGTLVEDRRAEVESHLALCAECGEFVRTLREARGRFDAALSSGVVAAALLGAGAWQAGGTSHTTAAAPDVGSLALLQRAGAPAHGFVSRGAEVLGGLKSGLGAVLLGSAVLIVGAVGTSLFNMPGGEPGPGRDEPVATATRLESSRSQDEAREPTSAVSQEQDEEPSDDAPPSDGGADGTPDEGQDGGGNSDADGGGDSGGGEGGPSAAELTVLTSDQRGGAFAPRLVGTSQPASSVSVVVSGLVFAVPVAEDGGWSVDLATLGLGAGSHRAQLTQMIDGVAGQGSPVSFELGVPGMTSSPVTPGAPDTRVPVALNGIAGLQVCVELGPGVYQRFGLDAGGAATGHLPYSPWEQRDVRLRYCDGDRFGAVGVATVGTAASSPP